MSSNPTEGRDVSPDREEGAPSAWDPDRTGPSRDGGSPEGHRARSEPWTETAEAASSAIRSDDDPQAGEPARLPDE